MRPASSHPLLEELGAYADEWRRDHAQAMQCRDLELLLRKGAALLKVIDAVAETRAGEPPSQGWEAARSVDGLYKWWVEAGTRALSILEAFERQGYLVVGGAAFRQSYEAARGIAALPLERLIETVTRRRAEPQRGYRSLGQLRDELQGRI